MLILNILSHCKVLTEHEAKTLANDRIVLGCKVIILFDGTAKGVFHGVAVEKIESMVDTESSSTLSTHLHSKVTLIVVEILAFLPQQIGDMPGYEGTVSVLAPIHEDSFLLRVSV